MSRLNSVFEWQSWFNRWEAMQSCYIPYRLNRFDLMINQISFPRESEVYVLDLGSGPGSLAYRVLKHYPNAHIVAVELNPILIKIGEAIRGENDHIRFLSVDIRERSWWVRYQETFDLVVSATALHWMNATHLEETYRQVFDVLKSGAWFLNSDHISADSPAEQKRYRQILETEQEATFGKTSADDWNGYWKRMNRELAEKGLGNLPSEVEPWEGNDDGLPRQFHIEALERCGFEQVLLLWQYLGEAVIGARKP